MLLLVVITLCVAMVAHATSITVVGLGPGSAPCITRETWGKLETTPRVHLRTAQHPAVADLPCRDGVVTTFDHLYERLASFSEVYDTIVDELVREAAAGSDVLYAVPGDPCVGEKSTLILRQRCAAAGIPFHVEPAVSFLEPSLSLLGADLLPCTTVIDAVAVAESSYPPFCVNSGGTLLCQVYSRSVASNVKLSLLAAFPPFHSVTLLHGEEGGGGEAVTLPLCEVCLHVWPWLGALSERSIKRPLQPCQRAH